MDERRVLGFFSSYLRHCVFSRGGWAPCWVLHEVSERRHPRGFGGRSGAIGSLILIAGFCPIGGVNSAVASMVVDFEDRSLAPDSYYNGSDNSGGFTSRGAFFNNTFTDFGGGMVAWSGWSYSNMTDDLTPGYDNQYSVVAGGGGDGSSNYAIGYAASASDAAIELPSSTFPQSLFVANTTYAYFAMLDGDPFAKQFGGVTGNDPDYLLLTIAGSDSHNLPIDTVDVYLADYRFEDNSRDYIVDTWTEVDLSAVAGATSLTFTLESSDAGPWGINTPAYFAIDNLHVVPEPTMGALAAFTCFLGLWGCRGRRAGG